MIVEYIRRQKNGRNVLIGALVGNVTDKGIGVGWSKVNIKAGDKFDKGVAVQLAAFRTTNNELAPHSLKHDIRRFEARCIRYFQKAPLMNRIQIGCAKTNGACTCKHA